MVLYQTKNFNIFPSAIQLGNMSKILTNNCDRETLKYIPKRELWINRLYFEIANKKDLQNTEHRLVIKFGKTVFLARKKQDRLFNRFTANNLEPDNKDSLLFTIEMTDKNSSIKERHLPYNQLLL